MPCRVEVRIATDEALPKVKNAGKALMIVAAVVVVAVLALQGAYWWSNIPPKRPKNVPADAVFLWAGHLGLPAPKHGAWIRCWTDTAKGVNQCRLTEMDGRVTYEGVFLADTGKTPVPQSDLTIMGEQTSQSVNLWVRSKGQLVPLVFLKNGTVLIPKDAYQDGMTKLEQLRQEQRK
jgi:hypothetical protein